MKDNFYSIADYKSADDALSCIVSYNAAHPIFDGHFPGNPIVPGVCTMAIIKALLEDATGQRLLLQESKAVKFLGLISPSMSPKISLSWKQDGSLIIMSASLHDGATVLFKMSGSYIKVLPH